MKVKSFLLAVLVFSSFLLNAQDYHKIDSLKNILKTLPELDGTNADTTRMQICLDIGDLYKNHIPDSAIWWYASVADTIYSTKKIKQFPEKSLLNSTALIYIGTVSLYQGDYPKAIEYYEKSMKTRKKLDDKQGISACLNNLGGVSLYQGDYPKAIKYYKKSMKTSKELDDKQGISDCLNNLGGVSLYQGDYPKAIKYYKKSMKTSKELDDKQGISGCLNNLGGVSMYQGDYPKAIKYYEKSLKIAKELGDKRGISACLNNLGAVSQYQGDYPKVIEYLEKSLKIDEELGDKKGISTCLMNLGGVSMYQGDYPKAIEYYEKSLKIAKELGDKKGISDCLGNLGTVASDQGDYSKAIEYYEKSLKIKEELDDKQGISVCFMSLGGMSYELGDYPKAIEYYKKSMEIKEELGNKREISECLNNLGNVSIYQGDYPKAIEYYEKSLKIAKELGDKYVISACLTNLGGVSTDKGDYPKAIEYFEKSMKIAKELGDKQVISGCFMNLGIVSYDQGDYPKAIEYYEKSKEIREELGDKQGISACFMSLGAVSHYQGDYPKAIEYFEKSLKIAKELGDKQGISGCFMNLGVTLADNGDYPKAIEYCEKSLKIAKELGDKYGISTCFIYLGGVADKQGDYSRAIKYLKKSLKIKEELSLKSDLASDYPVLANVYIHQNILKKAIPLFLKSREITLYLLKDNFTILSEKEKELYLNKTKSIFNDLHSFNINYPNQNDSLAELCYNNELILKGLLLKSTQSMLDAVYNSQDTALKNTYFLLKQYRNEISSLQGSEKYNRDSLIDNFEKKANEQERKLVKLSSEFANIQNLFNYKWEDVQKNLKPKEAAIEFISFTQGNKNDTIVYAALIITPESKKPISIKLFEDYQLQKIVDTYAGGNYQRVSKLYGTNQNINNELYKLIWQPLEQHLDGIKTVYFTPVGVLNKISFAALGDGKQMLCDKYNLNQVTSTAKVYSPENSMIASNITANIFGGINYNTDSTKTEIWSYLDGTLTETQIINFFFEDKNIKTNYFTDSDASEENFKKTSPDCNILHLATHGFFYPSKEEEKKEKSETNIKSRSGNSGFGVYMFAKNKNPLMRSGLVLAGANDVWQNKYSSDKEDGVLTAYEVSTIDLRKTQLVVLSACETGLGDIRGTEGVYGLQRAFKMAGAKFLIMSLWEVPDKETEEFMTTFYSKLLNLKDIKQAFNQTQKEMRAKYDPYYWAAFVLIE